MKIHYTIEDFIKDIHTAYFETFGVVDTDYAHGFTEGKYKNTVEMWIGELERVNGAKPTYEKWIKILEGIDVTQMGNLALFHYTSFDVIYGDWDPVQYWGAYGGIYRTCRSTVINLYSCETVIKPFDKFFNVNELPETSQDIVETLIEKAKTVEISEKLDGSIVCVSCRMVTDYRGTYKDVFICTSQSLNPETSWHLAEAEEMFYNSNGIKKLVINKVDWTFMFEMISKWDAHVVYYPESEYGLHLIGARDNTGRLLKYAEIIKLAEEYGIQTTKVFDKTFAQVLTELDDKKSDEAEGFVIRIDDEFFKLKYNDYVAMHKAINRLVSASCIIEAFKNGNIDDLMSKVPISYRDQVTEIVNDIKKCISSVNTVAEYAERECGKIPEFRDKMIWVQNSVPKMLRGFCIDAVKGNPVSIFRGNRVLKLSDIRKLLSVALDYEKENIHRPDNPYYGNHTRIIGDDNGEFMNFGHTSNHSDETLNY